MSKCAMDLGSSSQFGFDFDLGLIRLSLGILEFGLVILMFVKWLDTNDLC